ncbi:metal-sulfur cluster assembly factor [Lacticaseibacillus thailandensis]|uniref:metal-sulfur cluster assembly factor n=1 Tax=Lacticaseibacillus thailandensis TaxID=381741 RepID=UPI0006D189E5|nr:iron-sulfur cluster assembly protein [Lacticaseibacillus thailandensis]
MQLADYHATTENIDATTDAALTDALVQAVDPELMVDMLNLGLVYHVRRTDNGDYEVQMLLTQIGCPLTDYLDKMVQHAIALVAPDARCGCSSG